MEKRNNWVEPDDGFDSERDYKPSKTWEQYAKERAEFCERTWPGLFRRMEVLEWRRTLKTDTHE